MSLLAVIKLVKTFSSSEKRYFKLQSKKQVGNKEYLKLFDIINELETADIKFLKGKFIKLYPTSSFDNTLQYLMKVLTDCLIQSKMEKDVFFQSMQTIMRSRILQERSLPEESHKQLKKVRQVSVRYQKHFIEYLTYRYELDYFSESSFREITYESLIEKQMKAKDIIKNLNYVQDHYSLLEILKYRLIYSGKISSDDEKKRLNDLILSEMALVAGKAKNSFISQKLHLLFQSFFFINIGDYQSALKTFHQLNILFEQNQELLDHPPLDYLATLNGIIESMLMVGNFEDIISYINKLSKLDKPEYPQHFCFQVRKTIAVYQLAVFIKNENFSKAIEYIESFDPGFLKSYNMVNEEKQWELYFYCSLAYFGNRNWKKAHSYISKAMQENKAYPQLIICKAIRLLNIIIHFEKGDVEYLSYEIRSYKRFFRQHGLLLKSENLILKTIQDLSDHKKKSKIIIGQSKIMKIISTLKEDKYEKQLLKYLDFTDWIKKKTI